jgi:glycosyltransferase involved in cell wall biosynthesis
MFGLFVQKHAEAVSTNCRVKVLYVQPDEKINHFEIEEEKRNNLTELIVYYPVRKQKQYHKIINTINYCIAYWKGYKLIRHDNFQPDIVHANILTRTVVVAYLLKLLKGTPYLITEHWSRYLPARNSFNGRFRKLISRWVVKNARAILPVSENLKQAMLGHKLENNNYIVVNNVVDNYFFNENLIVHRLKKRIIHVSCFDEQAKNIKGMLRAVFELSKNRQDFELILIGTGKDYNRAKNYADKLFFPKGTIHFLGEKTSEEVANWMHNSDLLLLFSNYETAGVVIAESLICGKPVLTTNVGIAPEYINAKNGKIIPPKNEKILLEELNFMLDHLDEYNCNEIKEEVLDKFDYKSIGSQIEKIYTEILA